MYQLELDSMWNNKSGWDNIGIGRMSLAQNIESDRNICLGNLSLNKLITGNDNIAIGNECATESDNIENSINIGNSVIGNGSNTVTIGNGNITKVYMNDNGNAQIYANTVIQESDKNLKKILFN